MHEAHNSRILAIRPKSLKIRVFAPYDIVLPYHNQTAHISTRTCPDDRALRWHWEACVIENMTGMNPWRAPPEPLRSVPEGSGEEFQDVDDIIPSAKRIKGSEAFAEKPLLPPPAGPADAVDSSECADMAGGDVNTRRLEDQPVAENIAESTTAGTTPLSSDAYDASVHQSPPSTIPYKKRKLALDPPFFRYPDSHVTPENAMYFLADVNEELRRRCRTRLQ